MPVMKGDVSNLSVSPYVYEDDEGVQHEQYEMTFYIRGGGPYTLRVDKQTFDPNMTYALIMTEAERVIALHDKFE